MEVGLGKERDGSVKRLQVLGEDRETDADTDRRTGRQTDRQTDRQTEEETPSCT